MRLVSWKYGNAVAVCVMAIVLGQSGAAQEAREDQQTPRPAATPAPPAQPAASTPAPQPTPKPVEMPFPRRPLPAVANIRVDITITDQAGTEPPLKKTLSVIAADGANGAVRSKAAVAVRRFSDPKDFIYEDLPLNVDIRPEVTENENRIRTRLVLNYETFSSKSSDMPPVRSAVTVDQWVMLENGKPLVVSQSADATTDRRVTVELKATIMK